MSIDIGIIETPTVRQMFMERIAGMIVSGELKPGDKLPSEREMAAQAKISKSAVHFAGSSRPSCARARMSRTSPCTARPRP